MGDAGIVEAKKDSSLRRFGRDLTELAAQGALPPLIGRRKEMLKITQIRKHLRPELVNRLTKVVHFEPLGMDRMLGTLIADALLGGEITAGQKIQLQARDGQIQFLLQNPD